MKRSPVPQIRENWQAKLEEVGFHFYEMEGKAYWDESAFYELTSDEVDQLETVTDELYGMCLELVERVVREELYEQLAIPPGSGVTWRSHGSEENRRSTADSTCGTMAGATLSSWSSTPTRLQPSSRRV
jgi:glutathionylspermidine synthase